jgi:hypothetical protein
MYDAAITIASNVTALKGRNGICGLELIKDRAKRPRAGRGHRNSDREADQTNGDASRRCPAARGP